MHETSRGMSEWEGGSDVLLGGHGDGPHAEVLVVADVDHVRDAQAASQRNVHAQRVLLEPLPRTEET
jgi:hypothetical protein